MDGIQAESVLAASFCLQQPGNTACACMCVCVCVCNSLHQLPARWRASEDSALWLRFNWPRRGGGRRQPEGRRVRLEGSFPSSLPPGLCGAATAFSLGFGGCSFPLETLRAAKVFFLLLAVSPHCFTVFQCCLPWRGPRWGRESLHIFCCFPESCSNLSLWLVPLLYSPQPPRLSTPSGTWRKRAELLYPEDMSVRNRRFSHSSLIPE